MRTIRKHIIHCSDSPDHVDIGVTEIDRYHKDRGWNGCGYHNVIKRDGKLESGRPLSEVGAHCSGHNKDSIGTCLIGRNKFTDEQYSTLRRLHEDYEFTFPLIEIYGHRDFNKKKTCPNFDAIGWHELEKVKKIISDKSIQEKRVEKKNFMCIIKGWLKSLFRKGESNG